ncbi:succinate CoA transferase [Paenalcaligenes niemegkensis]|uniref:succinate CoA transferase n=1 Tax=Paenalcaligenes niemegkensis TaxID=2895469 RepID=UPI001EE8B61B|nr:succinate CoA transferase [Paenalcaligenes niemegkensis]MCQ9615322.1 succinate CoA transferase [Paenalcaligenes niemegkensis]
MFHDRIRLASLASKIMTADQAGEFFQDGMTVGMSGFTRAGDSKAMPVALAARAAKSPFAINLLTGASLGNDSDGLMASAGVLARRSPFQVDPLMRKKINAGELMFCDYHLSQPAEMLRAKKGLPIDIAVIEAVAITECGAIVPSTSVGNSASFVAQAKMVVVELNLSMPLELEGMHDIYLPGDRPGRQPIAITDVSQRIGSTSIAVDPDRIVGIVITDAPDSPSTALPPDEETNAIAAHVVRFLAGEVTAGRLTNELLPLQVGIGTIANAVTYGIAQSEFKNLTMYSEVLQDSAVSLLDSGHLKFASASSVTLSAPTMQKFLENLDRYRQQVVLRPQEISNHPEIVRRLGVIAINAALEFDIYGNVNSTHVGGTHMMNGIGGSGDFARNAHLSIFVTKSLAKGGDISRVVPMVSHVDHCEHDVDVLVTECGFADLRGLAPRERATAIIANCVHADYQPAMASYFERACQRGGHTPHLLEEAFSWHLDFRQNGSMKDRAEAMV